MQGSGNSSTKPALLSYRTSTSSTTKYYSTTYSTTTSTTSQLSDCPIV